MPGKDDPKVFFIGNGLSTDALNDTSHALGDMDFDVNVISKSGTTLEPAVCLPRLPRACPRRSTARPPNEHIFATTDAHRGALASTRGAEGWECFVVPDDVGGRYSVLSAVGLLPMAVAGIDIKAVITSAYADSRRSTCARPRTPHGSTPQRGSISTATATASSSSPATSPRFRFMAEWWKQLYGESEGKNGIGIFPASVEFTADLHSMGQYIQDGPSTLMETVVSFDKPRSSVAVPFEMGDPDGLNYLAGRDYAISAAPRATRSRPRTSPAACPTSA